MKSLIRNHVAGAKPEGWLTVKNDASAAAAEILIYGMIGKDWWDNSGIADTEFAQALSEIPVGRKVNLRINSQGGSVKDGLGIYSQISKRRNDVTCIVDGYACSTASWIALAGGKTVIPENGIIMIHNPSALAQGDAAALRSLATALDQHKASIVAMYRGKTGKGDSEISAAMDAETWFIGKEAKDWGLADEVTSLSANIQNNFDLSIFRRVPAGVTNAVQPPKKEVMNREQMIAMLKEHGIEVANDISEKDLLAKFKDAFKNARTPAPAVVPAVPATVPATAPTNATPAAPGAVPPVAPAVDNAMALRIAALEAQNANERTTRLRGELTAIANEGRIPLNSVENWLPLAVANEEKVMAQLRALSIVPIGAEPANAGPEIISRRPA
jgi:ATP-dependent Clp protease protease subunit